MYYYYRKCGLTTNEIADFLEDEIDDSDADKDYEPEKNPSDDSDSKLEALEVGRRATVNDRPEIWVCMDPPIERPDADTDKDSGKILILYVQLQYNKCCKRY